MEAAETAAVDGAADYGSVLRRPTTTPAAECPRRRCRVIRVEKSPSLAWRPACSTWKERAEKRSVFFPIPIGRVQCSSRVSRSHSRTTKCSAFSEPR